MEEDLRAIPAWTDPRFKQMLVGLAVTVVTSRFIGGRVWRIQKRLLIAGCAGGAAYGYLMELDDRRKGAG